MSTHYAIIIGTGAGGDPFVRDLNCCTHDIDTFYGFDGSVFCSSEAVNPTLTLIANALRGDDHLLGHCSNGEMNVVVRPTAPQQHSSLDLATPLIEQLG